MSEARAYSAILTNMGKMLVAQAMANNSKLVISHLAFGDGGGDEYYPTESQEALRKQLHQTEANHVDVDPENPTWVLVQATIPTNIGGWYVREVGVMAENGTLIAIASYPPTYKPVFEEGTGAELNIQVVMEVSNTGCITLKVNPSLVYATRDYVNNAVSSHATETNAHGATYDATVNRLMIRNNDGRCQVANPAADLDAVNKQTMDSALSAFDKGTYEATANRLMLRNANGRCQVVTPTVDADATNRGYVDSADAAIRKEVAEGDSAVQGYVEEVEKNLRSLIKSTADATRAWVDEKVDGLAEDNGWGGFVGMVTAFSGNFGGTGNKYPIDAGTGKVMSQWHVCDGTDGTPDLRDRFIIGASASKAAKSTGGSTEFSAKGTVSGQTDPTTLTIAQMASHGHPYNNPSDITAKWGNNANVSINSYVNGTTGMTGGGGSHQHGVTMDIDATAENVLPPYYAMTWIMKVS